MPPAPPVTVHVELRVRGADLDDLWRDARRIASKMGGQFYDVETLSFGTISMTRDPDESGRVRPEWGATVTATLRRAANAGRS